MSQYNIPQTILNTFDRPGFYIEAGASSAVDQSNTYTQRLILKSNKYIK